MKQSYCVPIRIYSEANNTDHWTKKRKRRISNRNAINVVCREKMQKDTNLPATVRLTRVAPRMLDIDNLWAGMKATIDTVADILIPGLKPGHADGDERLKFECCQKKGNPKEYSLEIEIFDSEDL